MAQWFRAKIKPLADWILLAAKDDTDFTYQDYLDIKKQYTKMYY